MKLTVIDIESFWSTTHSLSKMNPAVYIMHPDTEIQSAAIKEGDNETFVLFGDELTQWINDTDFSDTMLLGHNMSGFDAAILAWRFKVKPKAWACTLAMARHIGAAQQAGGSLKALAKQYGIGAKLDLEATNTKGKFLADFTPEEIEAMREYNKVDTDLCYGLFKRMLPELDTRALKLIDMTIRMMTEPKFVLDRPLLERTLVEIQEQKRKTLLSVGQEMSPLETGVSDDELVELARATLSSAPKFAAYLRSQNVDAPMKLNKNGKEIPALAKTDEGMQALLEHEDQDIAAAAAARLGVKSTQLETRIQSFIEVGNACRGRLPVFLLYAGAGKTLRWSGCLVADTEVIVYNLEHGIQAKRIVDVLLDDLVWDGEEFVAHEGVTFSGYAEVITWDGVTGTEDHEVFTSTRTTLSLSEARSRRVPLQVAGDITADHVDAAREYAHDREF